MFMLLIILIGVVLILHFISLFLPVLINLAAIFTVFVYIYALFVVLASFKEHEDRFVFLNLYLATLVMPGSVELATELGYGYPTNIMVWLTTFFVVGLIALIFSLRKMEKYELIMFSAFLIILNAMNTFFWVKFENVQFELSNLLIAYYNTAIKSALFFYSSFLNMCYDPSYIFYLKGEEQIFIVPFFILLSTIILMLRKI
ncbi:hypothetical protein DRO97_03030 [Archaeoglobales archaeon]|nr:MAG: hypothetical protein DRO97_03030 [Archaeoglobales archaeon]